MSRINIGGRVGRPVLRRDLSEPHTAPDPTESHTAAADPVVVPSQSLPEPEPVKQEGISPSLAQTLAEEHHAGQPVDLLAMRWGLEERDVVKAITSTGSVVNQ